MVNRIAIGGILCACALFGAAAQAAVPWHQVAFEPANPQPGQPFQLRLSGSMPDTCGVAYERTELSSSGLRVHLSRPGGLICGDAVTPYEIRIDVTAAVGNFEVSGHYPVHVSLSDQAGSRDIAFGLLNVVEAGRAQLPDAGFWVADASGRYPTGGSGVGFNIERQSDAIALIAYYYDPQGQPRWYFSAGTAGRNEYRGELLQITGGQQLFGLYRPPGDMSAFSRIDVGFTNRSHGEAWVSQALDTGILAEVQVQPVSLVRFGFRTETTAATLAGRWVLVDLGRESGSGTVVNLEAAPQLGPDHVRATDPRTQVTVDCSIVTEQRDQPPVSCALSIESSRAAVLNNNSFNELRSPDGNFRLIRLD
ncbi:MAG: hypothetical protein KDI48_04725 [Xanthomonadales bacterium]|nr:hypothetical protein [Xanthomonadales bacterium]